MTQLFDKFEILECLKRDTQSSVYRARHIYLGKNIVLKVLEILPDQEDEPLHRFKREARILARLDHPNIIKIIDFGISENQTYISFEYFESQNLRSLMKSKTLSSTEKSDLFRQLVQGLEAAHAGGIIHRDLKPENILINSDRQLKIADFGLAILQDDITVTNKSSLVGTPAYMSPEQIRGEPLTYSSDLFALGIIGFELFCSYNPFAGKDINETLNAILSSSKDTLTQKMSELNDPYPEILGQLLHRDPDHRGTSKEILVLLGEEPVPEKQTHHNKIRISPLIVSVFLVICAVLISWFYLSADRGVQHVPDLSSMTDTIKDSVEDLADQKTMTNKIVEPAKYVSGILLIEVRPASDIYLNGELRYTDRNKCTINLSPGEYDIRMVREEYPTYSQKVTVRESELTSVNVTLDSLFGYFTCQVHPWGDISLNNKFIGQTPLLKKIKIVPGHHILRIENPNFQIFEDTITIKSGQTTDIRVNLESITAPQVIN